MLDIDPITIIFQIINFLVLVIVLYFLLFKKIIQRAETRKQELEQMRMTTELNLKSSEQLKSELEEQIKNFDIKVEESLDEAQNDLEKIRKKVIEEVKKEAEHIFNQNKASIELAQSQSLEIFHNKIIETAITISKKMLQKTVTDEMHDLLIEQINKRVLDLARKEISQIETIRKSLTDREPVLYIQTAKTLKKEQHASLIKTFSAIADKSIKIDIKHDEELICGIRVRLGNYIVDNALSSKLEEIGDSVMNEWQELTNGTISK